MPTDYYFKQTVKSMSDDEVKYLMKYATLDEVFRGENETFTKYLYERYNEIISDERNKKINDILNGNTN